MPAAEIYPFSTEMGIFLHLPESPELQGWLPVADLAPGEASSRPAGTRPLVQGAETQVTPRARRDGSALHNQHLPPVSMVSGASRHAAVFVLPFVRCEMASPLQPPRLPPRCRRAPTCTHPARAQRRRAEHGAEELRRLSQCHDNSRHEQSSQGAISTFAGFYTAG